MQGKYREFHRFQPRSPRSAVETAIIIRALRVTQRNRELIGTYQGSKSTHQGSFLPVQGRVSSLGFVGQVRGKVLSTSVTSYVAVFGDLRQRWKRFSHNRRPTCRARSLPGPG